MPLFSHDFSPFFGLRDSSCLTWLAFFASSSAPAEASELLGGIVVDRGDSRAIRRASGSSRLTIARLAASQRRVLLGGLHSGGALLADLARGAAALARLLGVGVGLHLGLERGESLHHGAVIVSHGCDYGMIAWNVAARLPLDLLVLARARFVAAIRTKLERRASRQTTKEKQRREAKASGEMDEGGRQVGRLALSGRSQGVLLRRRPALLQGPGRRVHRGALQGQPKAVCEVTDGGLAAVTPRSSA